MKIEHVTAFLYALKPRGIRFGLENTRLVLERLGNPQQRFQVIHVAGSNGKGSVCAFLDAMLRAQGYQVGLYTSPHLNHFLERFRVSGVDVADRAIVEAMEPLLRTGLGVEPAEVMEWVQTEGMVEKMCAESWYCMRGGSSQFCTLTFFECTTVLAVLLFAAAGVEIAVMETGMGGRLDATNVFSPIVSAITPIHLEHTQYLGSTLAAIAGEKAGIIKPGIPVVSAPQAPEAGAVIHQVAADQQAPLIQVGESVRGWGSFRDAQFQVEDRAFGPLQLGLSGEHQVVNAATALGCLPALARAGYPISDEAVRRGLREVYWPGRFERFGANGEWILDGAHNPTGMTALVKTVREEMGDKPIHVVFGVFEDKDGFQMLSLLEPILSHLELTRPTDARGRDPGTLLPALHKPHRVHPSIPEALECVWHSQEFPVLICGSLNLVADARAWLLEKGIPRWGHSR